MFTMHSENSVICLRKNIKIIVYVIQVIVIIFWNSVFYM